MLYSLLVFIRVPYEVFSQKNMFRIVYIWFLVWFIEIFLKDLKMCLYVTGIVYIISITDISDKYNIIMKSSYSLMKNNL